MLAYARHHGIARPPEQRFWYLVKDLRFEDVSDIDLSRPFNVTSNNETELYREKLEIDRRAADLLRAITNESSREESARLKPRLSSNLDYPLEKGIFRKELVYDVPRTQSEAVSILRDNHVVDSRHEKDTLTTLEHLVSKAATFETCEKFELPAASLIYLSNLLAIDGNAQSSSLAVRRTNTDLRLEMPIFSIQRDESDWFSRIPVADLRYATPDLIAEEECALFHDSWSEAVETDIDNLVTQQPNIENVVAQCTPAVEFEIEMPLSPRPYPKRQQQSIGLEEDTCLNDGDLIATVASSPQNSLEEIFCLSKPQVNCLRLEDERLEMFDTSLRIEGPKLSLQFDKPDLTQFPQVPGDLCKQIRQTPALHSVELFGVRQLDMNVKWNPFLDNLAPLDLAEPIMGSDCLDDFVQADRGAACTFGLLETRDLPEPPTSPMLTRPKSFKSPSPCIASGSCPSSVTLVPEASDMLRQPTLQEESHYSTQVSPDGPVLSTDTFMLDTPHAPRVLSDTSPSVDTSERAQLISTFAIPELRRIYPTHDRVLETVEITADSSTDQGGHSLNTSGIIAEDSCDQIAGQQSDLDFDSDDSIRRLLEVRRRNSKANNRVQPRSKRKNFAASIDTYMRIQGIRVERSTSPIDQLQAEDITVSDPQEPRTTAPKLIAPLVPESLECAETCSWLISTTLLQRSRLTRMIRTMNPGVHFVERDLDVMEDADLVTTRSTGILSFRIEHIQTIAAEQVELIPAQVRLSNVLRKYQSTTVFVIYTEFLRDEHSTALVALRLWADSYMSGSFWGQIIAVSSEEAQARYISCVGRMAVKTHGPMILSAAIEQESEHEVFLQLCPYLSTVTAHFILSRVSLMNFLAMTKKQLAVLLSCVDEHWLANVFEFFHADWHNLTQEPIARAPEDDYKNRPQPDPGPDSDALDYMDTI